MSAAADRLVGYDHYRLETQGGWQALTGKVWSDPPLALSLANQRARQGCWWLLHARILFWTSRCDPAPLTSTTTHPPHFVHSPLLAERQVQNLQSLLAADPSLPGKVDASPGGG